MEIPDMLAGMKVPHARSCRHPPWGIFAANSPTGVQTFQAHYIMYAPFGPLTRRRKKAERAANAKIYGPFTILS